MRNLFLLTFGIALAALASCAKTNTSTPGGSTVGFPTAISTDLKD